MVRKGVYLTDYQVNFIAQHNELTEAEHIRRAIDDYIDTLRSWDACASTSKIIKNTKDGRNTNTKA
jgi:hypothetical protein